MKIQQNTGWINVCRTDPSKSYVIGGSEEANERVRNKYLGDDYQLPNSAKAYNDQSINCRGITQLEMSAYSAWQSKQISDTEKSTCTEQAKSKEEMSLDEYKSYFQEKMNGLYTHPSQINMNDVIEITDSAYKRMQTDSAYEEKILNAIVVNKAVNFGGYIPVIAFTHIDDTYEGCYGYTKGMEENTGYVNSSSSASSKNNKTKKAEMKKQDIEAMEEKIEERNYFQELRTKEYLEHKEQTAKRNKSYFAAKAYESLYIFR